MSNSAAPASIHLALDRAGLNHRPILLEAATPMALDGKRVPHWLVVTADHVNVVGDGPPQTHDRANVACTIARDAASSFRTQAGVGSGMLQVRTGDAWTDLIRYSNAEADQFHKVAEQLEQWRESGEIATPVDGSGNTLRCQHCGLRLPAAGEGCPRCAKKSEIVGRVWQMVKPHWRGAVALMTLTLCGVALELLPPKLQQYLVDDVLRVSEAPSATAGAFSALAAVVFALAISRAALSYLGACKGKLATRLGGGMTHQLRGQLVDRLHQLPLSYFDRHQSGSLMSRVAYDTEVLHGLIHQITGGFLLQILQLIGVGAMLLALNAKLALYTLAPVPLVIGGTWFFWQRIYPRYYRYWDASSKQVAGLVSMLSGIRVVRGFAQEPRELARFQKSSDTLRGNRLYVEESTANYSAWMQLIFGLGGLIVWYVGGRDVVAGKMTLGSLIAFLAYLAMFYAPLGALSQFTTWLTSFLTGARRVMELLDAPLTVREPALPQAPAASKGRIVFENVRFGYERNRSVLKDVSFAIEPGETIGIVGKSGSGKTTLVNLLGRFYDVDDGRITVDGIDVRDYGIADLHRRIGIVFQEPYLFRGSIWENLAYGRPDASIEAGLQAAKAAGCHDFILRSTLGYETMLGENGAGLSGGERQRLSIARALLYDPPILVLDEATSSVDTETERGIQQAIERLTANRTTIAIAHRLSTLRHADRILVFDKGKLAEEGSHDALLERNGIYARLVRIQTQLTGPVRVDRLMESLDESDDRQEPSAAAKGQRTKPNAEATESMQKDDICWPEAGSLALRRDSLGRLCVDGPAGEIVGAFAVRCFPATRPAEFISIRHWDADGDEVELGIVRDLSAWQAHDRLLIEEALDRRYLMRDMESIDGIEFRHGYLWIRGRIDGTAGEVCLRWNQSQALDFGPTGKLLLDVDDNRFLVRNVSALPAAQERLFRRYIYW